jgi:type VI secretion system protein ImpH
MNLDERLFREGYAFDFFQAVRLLSRLDRTRRPVGQAGPPPAEVARFRAHMSLAFPPSTVFDIAKPTADLPVPRMTVTFMGLYGPSGILPTHYTQELLRLDRDVRTPERYALRAWLDMFNHRLISLFYRAWEKYRFWMRYEDGEAFNDEPDSFTQCLFSILGTGLAPLRKRLRVVAVPPAQAEQPVHEQPLARIDDLALLHYAGLLVQRPRSAANLEALTADFFGLPVRVQQFRGQWLPLDGDSLTRLGEANSEMGVSIVAGERVWDIGSKLRLRIGPVDRERFVALLPDRSPTTERKMFFLLVHLVRLFLGPDLDFDVQVVLRAADVPECQLAEGGLGPRLGWNTWMRSGPMPADAADAVFEGLTVCRVESA